MTVAAHPSLLGIPLECRLPIYVDLFAGLIYDRSYRLNYVSTDPAKVKSRSAILRTCKRLREEALHIFGSSVEVSDPRAHPHDPLPTVFECLTKIRTSCYPEEFKDLLREQPLLEQITSTIGDDQLNVEYEPIFHIDQLSQLLCGEHDNNLINRNILHSKFMNKYKYKSRLMYEIDTARSDLKRIKQDLVRLEVSHTARFVMAVQGIHPVDDECKVDQDNLYRVTIDSESRKLIRREINVRDEWNEGDMWIPAEKVVLIEQDISDPFLYVPETGRFCVLAWTFTNDGVQLYFPDDPNPREQVKVELEDEENLKILLESAIRCVPKQGKKRDYDQVD